MSHKDIAGHVALWYVIENEDQWKEAMLLTSI